jgi:hypothetical protein
MTWHTAIVHKKELDGLLGIIRRAGGKVTSSRPCPAGYCVSYVTRA